MKKMKVEDVLNNMKYIAISAIVLGYMIISASGFLGDFLSKYWLSLYRSELDNFFGKGNWSCVSEETKDSIFLTKTYGGAGDSSDDVPEKYQNWYIRFLNRNNEEETYRITNHVYKMNQDSYLFSWSKRLSAKQALTQQLMDISLSLAGDKAEKELVEGVFSKEEADCMEITVTYSGGNPKPKFYDFLRKEKWFNAQDISAEHYLAYERHDFYLEIHIFDYLIEKISEEKQKHMMDSMDIFVEKLLQKYGDNASFWILGDGIDIAYQDGKKVEK